MEDKLQEYVEDVYFMNQLEGNEEHFDVVEKRFTIDNEDALDWVLGKHQDAQVEVMAMEVRLASMIKQLRDMKRKAESRRDWIERRFKAEAEQYMNAIGKKTLSLPHGTVRLRTSSKISVKVTDPKSAIPFMQEDFPHAVVMDPRITVSALSDADREKLLYADSTPGISVTLPLSSVTFDTLADDRGEA